MGDNILSCPLRGFSFYCAAALILACTSALQARPDSEALKSDSCEISDSLPAAAVPLQAALFKVERFELLGKLMTLLLKKDDKAYRIIPLRDSLFSLQSRNSIKEGSTLRIFCMDTAAFTFKADLQVKKIVRFHCLARAWVVYFRRGRHIICRTKVVYQAPALIEDVDKAVKVITGRKFIAYKINDFIGRLHKVLTILDCLDPADWQARATDSKLLSSLYYPCSFSPQEIAFVSSLINARSHSRTR